MAVSIQSNEEHISSNSIYVYFTGYVFVRISFITDYKLAAQQYDKERTPVASDVIASLLRTHSGKELKVNLKRRNINI